ncbi:MAG: hypothetical protein ACYTE8_01405 [Planctomycetota bacterium]|jgi:hypothetical protein
MKTKTITFYGILIAVQLLILQPCYGVSFFEMTLERDSIYTPGNMNITMKLTDKAKLESEYRFQVSVYVTDTLIRKQILPVTKNKPVIFELAFPEAHSKTDVRCRVELFINGQFVEAAETPLILWPSLAPHLKKPKDKVIWVFDISGKLQKHFGDLEVEAVDATFQAARNFGTPDIVFIGQNLDPNSMRVITSNLASVDNKPVTIFLKQNQLPKNSNIKIPKENNQSINVVCNPDSPLLKGLTKLDLMHMVDKAIYIKVRKQKDKDWAMDSFVTEISKDKKYVYSYLVNIQNKEQFTIYCQLPITDSDDPRYGVLLKNLLELANKISDSQKKINKSS